MVKISTITEVVSDAHSLLPWVRWLSLCLSAGLVAFGLIPSPANSQTTLGFHSRRLQVTLSAAKLGARVGAVHEKARPGGICLCINRREDQGTWGLAREDARESARNRTRGRP